MNRRARKRNSAAALSGVIKMPNRTAAAGQKQRPDSQQRRKLLILP
jgi:hypothetical protein